MKFIVPYAYILYTEYKDCVPQCYIIEAESEEEALEKAKEEIIEEERDDCAEPENFGKGPSVWYYRSNQQYQHLGKPDEEGYVLGDPVELT